MSCNWVKRGIVVLLLCSPFVLCRDSAFAGKKNVPNIPDPDKLVLEAQKMVTEEQKALYEQLPIEESSRDGYWWNKQDKNEKLSYVKVLIAGFDLTDKKVMAKKIVQALDMEYNPKDNPLDIKMNRSVERMFNVVTKEMMLK